MTKPRTRSLCATTPVVAAAVTVLTALLPANGYSAPQAPQTSPADAEATYTRTIQQRADKIVAALGISDPARSGRVRDLIMQQYRDLRTIQDAHETPEATKKKLDALHPEYLHKLAAELTPDQVDKVKDGMTYGVLPLTYRVYQEMYPALTTAQKAQILAWLTEARENAMDAGTAKEKHAWFGKYKGRINNYLVKEGYTLNKGGQAPAPAEKPEAKP